MEKEVHSSRRKNGGQAGRGTILFLCFIFFFFCLPFLSHCIFFLISLSLSLSLSLPLLKWQQTPPTLGGQAKFFVCLEKARPGIVTVGDLRSSRLTSLYRHPFSREISNTKHPASSLIEKFLKNVKNVYTNCKQLLNVFLKCYLFILVYVLRV